MLKSRRFSIAGLMGAVLVAAIGLAALHDSSTTSAGIIFLLTCAILSLGIVGLVFRRSERAWWFGFSLFGWVYLLLAFWSMSSGQITLPTESLLRMIGPLTGDQPSIFDPAFPVMAGHVSRNSFLQIGHCLWALLAAVLGGLLSRRVFGAGVARQENPSAGAQPPVPEGLSSSLKPAILGFSGCAVITMAIMAGRRLDPSARAGLVFLLTSGLICLACLGALVGRGKHRQIWLGAALFGAGFMILIFGWSPQQAGSPNSPTDRFLTAVQPWLSPLVLPLPPGSFNAEAENARIRRALEHTVKMEISGKRVEEVMEYVEHATRDADGRKITTYVDPRAPGAAEGVFAPTMWIKMQGIPLKTSLRLCLKQLDLDYDVRDGLLFISSPQEISRVSPPDHSYFIVGHCVLALIATVIGGVLAPLVADWRRAPAR